MILNPFEIRYLYEIVCLKLLIKTPFHMAYWFVTDLQIPICWVPGNTCIYYPDAQEGASKSVKVGVGLKTKDFYQNYLSSESEIFK